MTSTINIGDNVFVNAGTARAVVVGVRSDGCVQIKWPDNAGEKWETLYPPEQLSKLEKRRIKLTKRLEDQEEEEEEAPKKKIKKESKKKGTTTEAAALPDDSNVKLEGNNDVPPPDAKKKTTKNAVPNLWEVTGVDQDQGLSQIAKLLPKGLRKCKKQVAHFFLFCYERQMVWERRNRGDEAPYTESVAMQQYFFCNNYRELDRGTNYFRAHVLDLWDEHHRDEGFDNLAWIELVLWASLCYRLVNRISTFEEFGGIPAFDDWPRLRTFMREHAGTRSLCTDAHQTAGPNRFVDYMNAVYNHGGEQLQEVSQLLVEASNSERNLEACFDAVKTINGVGPFFAWQVVCDLMESNCLQPCTENDWTELGPGARGGIDIIFAAGKHQNFSYLELAVTLQEIQDDVFTALNIEFPKWNGMPLTLKNIEHPLCEFKKYNDIHGSLRKRMKPLGQRLVKSRTEMDFGKACFFVKHCGVSEDILFCDKCLVGFCEHCALRDEDPDHWVCPRCTGFEKVTACKSR